MSTSHLGPISIFFTHGVSLELWEKRGLFSREVKFYQALAEQIGEMWFFTYGRNDKQYVTRLGPHIRLFQKSLTIPNLLYGFMLPFLFWNILRKAKFIRIHQMAGAIPVLIIHWLLKKPLIVRCGFQWFIFAQHQHASKIKLAFITWIERLTYRAAKLIIHTTQQDADFIHYQYGIDRKKIHIIANPIDTELFKPMDIKKENGSICFVGRFEPQKNLLMLIEAMEGTNATLVLYGDGSLEQTLKERAQRLNVNVEFRGRITNEQLPTAMNTCEIFILPSLYEGNPKVLLEAMACGLPVIGTDVEGIRNIIKHNFNGLLCETNARSINQTIGELLINTDEKKRLGTAARTCILETCSLSHAIEKESQLIKQMYEYG